VTTPQPYNPEATGEEMTPGQREVLAKIKDVEKAMLEFAEDWKYPHTPPRGPKGEKVVLLLDYLLPDLQHMLAYHYISRGWRRHDELAIIKPRKIIGGMFEDLVTYVPVDEPSDPIVINHEPQEAPDMDEVMTKIWSVKPEVKETFEERTEE